MKHIILILAMLLPVIVQSQVNYPGTTVPTDSALLFAPELINSGMFTRDFSMTPDGEEIYFSIMSGRDGLIMVSKQENGKWLESEVVSFSGSGKYKDFEPHVSPDGNSIYFLSTRPTTGEQEKAGWGNQNIFKVERTSKGWTDPIDLGDPINTENNEFYPSLTSEGNLYYNHSVQFTDVGIYCSKYLDGKFLEPEKLSFPNDSNLLLFNSTVSRDETFILTCGSSKSNPGQTKYYVSFNNGMGEWSSLMDLTDYLGYEGGRAASISLSPDGKFIFFSAIVTNHETVRVKPGMKLSEIIENNMKPQSGSSNIYWISSDFINDLKKEAVFYHNK